MDEWVIPCCCVWPASEWQRSESSDKEHLLLWPHPHSYKIHTNTHKGTKIKWWNTTITITLRAFFCKGKISACHGSSLSLLIKLEIQHQSQTVCHIIQCDRLWWADSRNTKQISDSIRLQCKQGEYLHPDCKYLIYTLNVMVDTGYVFIFEWLPSPVSVQVRWVWRYGGTMTSQDTHPHMHSDWGALPFARLWVWICVVYGDAAALLQSTLTCRHAVLPRTECVLTRKQMERCQCVWINALSAQGE